MSKRWGSYVRIYWPEKPSDRLPSDPPEHIAGAYFPRDEDGVWMKEETRDIRPHMEGRDAADAIRIITEATEGLEDTQFYAFAEHIFDGAYGVEMTISGVREATAEEITWVEWKVEFDRNKRENEAQRQIDVLEQQLAQLKEIQARVKERQESEKE